MEKTIEKFLSTLKRLWINSADNSENVHSAAIFRRHFKLDKTVRNCRIFIGCDTDFILACDGIELGRGQYSDDPAQKTFTIFDISELAAGEHVIAVKVYYCGSEFSTYSPGLPGLYFAMQGEDFLLSGDEKFLAIPDPSFERDPAYKVSMQLGFTTCYDLRKALEWSAMDCPDDDWPSALVLTPPENCQMLLRPDMPRPRMQEFTAAGVLAHGIRRCKLPSTAEASAAERIAATYLCFDPQKNPQLPLALEVLPGMYKMASGIWVLADLGYEECGFIEFELDAPAGSKIYYAHGEHIDDHRVRTDIFYRHFADTVIWAGGRRVFQLPFRRAGFRYLELHVEFPEDVPQRVEFFRIGVRPWSLELPAEPEHFNCSCDKLNILHGNALHTLKLCMHDHYEDCPWREQALYSYDARWQMLYGYYNWGNYDFAAASINLFRPGQFANGHLRICAPSRNLRQIPVFSFVWLNMLYEYYFYSADSSFVKSCRSTAAAIADLICSRLDESTGLLREDEGNFWHFYEWCDGLHGYDDTAGRGFSALYNGYALAALEAYSRLYKDSEIDEFAARLRKNIFEKFYQPETGLFASRIIDSRSVDGFHEHTQSLMVVNKVAPPEICAELSGKILSGQCGVPAGLSAFFLTYQALKQQGVAGKMILEKLLEKYQPMLENNTGTLWETLNGSFDFGFAGSLCHGWSALPTLAAKNMITGVSPLTPGWKETLVAPDCAGLTHAAGTVATPHGTIEVSWQGNGQEIEFLQIRHPSSININVQSSAQIKIEKY